MYQKANDSLNKRTEKVNTTGFIYPSADPMFPSACVFDECDYFMDYDDDYEYACASGHECTGAVPIAPQDEDELDNYDDLTHFGPRP